MLPSIIDKIEGILSVHTIPGLGLVIRSPQGNTIQGFGFANIDAGTPIEPDSLWQLASLSKNISATCAAWLLQDEEIISYSTPINSYACKTVKFATESQTSDVSIRSCFSHTTGVQEQAGSDMATYGYGWRDIVETFRYYPNIGFQYFFNYGNETFSLGLESLTRFFSSDPRRALAKFFKHFQMTSTTTSLRKVIESPKKVTSYSPDKQDVLLPTQTFDSSAFVPAGGISSTLSDLDRYLQIHLGQEIQNLSAIYSPVTESGIPNGKLYGMGTAIDELVGDKVLFHQGLYITGFSHICLYSIEYQIGIVILTNSVNALPQPLAYFIYALLRGSTFEEAAEIFETLLKDIQADLDTLKCDINQKQYLLTSAFDRVDLTGNYFSSTSSDLRISESGIKVGRLGSVPFDIVDGQLIFTVNDVNNQQLECRASPIIDDCGYVIGLNTYIDCSYDLYERV